MITEKGMSYLSLEDEDDEWCQISVDVEGGQRVIQIHVFPGDPIYLSVHKAKELRDALGQMIGQVLFIRRAKPKSKRKPAESKA